MQFSLYTFFCFIHIPFGLHSLQTLTEEIKTNSSPDIITTMEGVAATTAAMMFCAVAILVGKPEKKSACQK